VVLYGCETLSLTLREEHRLGVFGNRVLIKSMRMRWAGHVARMGRSGIYIGFWWETQKESDHWKDQDVDGWTILKWILER
jgi:hypothetical protein